MKGLPGVATAEADKTNMTATIVYDKSIFDVNSVGDKERYKFKVQEDSAAESGDDAPADGKASDV